MFDINKCKNVNEAICKAMNELINSPFGEDFGREHIRAIEDRFGTVSYLDGEDFRERQMRLNNIAGFISWCADYVPLHQ